MTNKSVNVRLTEDEIQQLIMAINYYFEESGNFDETLDNKLQEAYREAKGNK